MDLKYSCVILGSSGETGRELINKLASNESINEVVCINRRHISDYEPMTSTGKTTTKGGDVIGLKLSQIVVDFHNLESHKEVFDRPFDIAFCVLGSSLTKATREEYEFVEKDLIVTCAKMLALAGCKQFHLVTGAWSHPESYFYIPRIKGQCEQEILKMSTNNPFQYTHKGTRGFEKIMIYRPGLLRLSRGRQRRRGNNFRVLEWMARQFCALFDWGDWLSISTDDLSTVMIANSLHLEDLTVANQHETKKIAKTGSFHGITVILEHSDIVGHMIKNLCNVSRQTNDNTNNTR